jgi:hypothetical protein
MIWYTGTYGITTMGLLYRLTLDSKVYFYILALNPIVFVTGASMLEWW